MQVILFVPTLVAVGSDMCGRLCALCDGQPLSSPDRFACGVALPLAQRNHHLTPPFVALKVCSLGHGAARRPMKPTRSLSQLLALVREALHEVCFRSEGVATHTMKPITCLSQLLAQMREALDEGSGVCCSNRHLRLPKGVAS